MTIKLTKEESENYYLEERDRIIINIYQYEANIGHWLDIIKTNNTIKLSKKDTHNLDLLYDILMDDICLDTFIDKYTNKFNKVYNEIKKMYIKINTIRMDLLVQLDINKRIYLFSDIDSKKYSKSIKDIDNLQSKVDKYEILAEALSNIYDNTTNMLGCIKGYNRLIENYKKECIDA